MVKPASPRENPYSPAEIGEIADFVLMAQRTAVLEISDTLNKGNISYPQFFLLAYLASEEYLTMTDIAKKMGHSTAAATGLVDRMEKLDFMERVHAKEDRRKIMVRITPKGVAFVEKIRLEIAGELASLLQEWESGKSTTIGETKKALGGLTAREVIKE